MNVARASARRNDGRGWTLASLLVAAIVLAPIAALFTIAAQGSGDLWSHLLTYVLPQAIPLTALLLLGVASSPSWSSSYCLARHPCRFPVPGFSTGRCFCPAVPPTRRFAYLASCSFGPIHRAPSALSIDIRRLWLLLRACLLHSLLCFDLSYVYPLRATFLIIAPRYSRAHTVGAPPFDLLRVALPLARLPSTSG